MVKIPATQEGLPAITECLIEGVNINVTLIFSLVRYADVISAFVRGLEIRNRLKNPIENLASVASFFVSRVDTKVDRRLDAILRGEHPNAGMAMGLRGTLAVANAKLAYLQYLEVFEGETFASLRDAGARAQRPLWASTSTKDPSYSDVKYVEELVAPNTVNTVPQTTLDAFRDHGTARVTITEDLDGARSAMEALEYVGISMAEVTRELEEEGVKAFADSYDALIEGIEARRQDLT
jgi:transaldolase